MEKNIRKLVFVVPLLAPYNILRFESMAKIEDLEVHVIVERNLDKERAGWKFQKIPGCHVYLLGSRRFKSYQVKHKREGYSIEQSRFYPLGLKNLIEKINPDMVLVCNAMQTLFIYGKRRYRLGIIVEDTLRAAEGRTPVNKWIKKVVYNRVDFCVPFTESAVQFLEKNNIQKPMIKSSWSIEPDFFQDLNDQETKEFMCKNLNLSLQKKKYLIVSNLIVRKGILPFLNAWKDMPPEFTYQSELYICGDGPLRNDISAYLIDYSIKNVHLLGTQSYKNVSHYLQCCDIFVLPTLEDLCSLVVFEAMAAGRPVLTTVYNGAKEMIIEGKNGYIFDVMDKLNTCKMLEKIGSADLYSFSKKSLEIIQNYTNEKVMRQLNTNLSKIL